MKLSFKQFLIESRGFDQIQTAMQLFDDEIVFIRKTKNTVEYEMTDEYWASFDDAKLKKLQSYFGDDVFILKTAAGGLVFRRSIAARVVGKRKNVRTLDDHVKFHEDTLDFIEQKQWHIEEKELYADREVADRINAIDEIFFLTNDGVLVLSGGTSWGVGKEHLVQYKEYSKLEVGDVVYLLFDEEESDRIKRFKYLGTK